MQGFEAWAEVVASGTSQILDLYPIFRKLPDFLAPNYRHAQQLHREEKNLYTGHWLDTKKRIEKNNCHVSCFPPSELGISPTEPLQPCFSTDVYLSQKAEGFSDDQAGYITGSLLEAGSDTTSGILVGFIQAMILFPEVQKKAQEEIDRVVGPDRMPIMEDSPDMPYIRACVKESLRWMPTVIMGVPHSVIQDDTYMGYKIPEGATIINNVW